MNLITQSYLSLIAGLEMQRLMDYQKYDTYYDNKQILAIPEKYKEELDNLGIKTNYVALVVDAFVAKLKVKGITTSSDSVRKKIEEVWERNRMDALKIKIHRITAKKGDCYIIVWPDSDKNIVIKVVSPEFMCPVPDSEDDEKVLYYKKQWNIYLGDKLFVRKDVFYTDRIERYISQEGSLSWQPYIADGFPEMFKNPYNILPVVHFRNKIDEGLFGISEVRDAIPIQDDINRTIMDMLLAAGYLGFGQIYIAGATKIDIDKNNPQGLNKNPGSCWVFPNPTTKVEKLQAESLTSFIEAIDAQVNHLSVVTRTPLFYLQASQTMPSGIALRELESPLLDKVAEAQISLGNTYEDINKLILIESGMKEESTSMIWEAPSLTAEEVRNDLQMLVNNIISRKQVLRRQGYDENEITQILKEADEESSGLPIE